MTFRIYIKLLLLTSILALGVSGQNEQKAVDSVLVIPFENRSGKGEFNWVGESFAMSLTEILQVPGLNVISNGERKAIQQRLRVPLSHIPSLATSLKLAKESGATLLISGRYTIIPAQDDVAATVNVTARIIRVNEGRFLSEVIDGRQVQRDIVLTDALGNLQTMQGQIAYQVLYQRDKALPYSQNQLIDSASKVPPRAFEAYIKGLLTPSVEHRENYLRNAMRLFSESGGQGVFVDAALELGHIYLNQRKHSEAVESFERVVSSFETCRTVARNENRVSHCNDESFAEASFYIGLIRWQQKNYEQALAVLRPLADELKLTSVYNSLGAIAIQSARAEKKNDARSAALVNEGLDLLEKAAISDPDDLNVRFNYAVALFLLDRSTESAEQFRNVIAARPADGESYYMLAKVLGRLNDPTTQAIDDQARTYLNVGNRYASLEKEWIKSKTISEIDLRVEQPQRSDFLSVVFNKKASTPAQPQQNETESLLTQARTQFKNGNDDEALITLRRVLASEPMSAESYLILGKIHLRRRDLDQAVSSFKTAIFWDNRLAEAHVALGRIYLEKGECMQVKNYSVSAAEIAPEDKEVIALKRQADRCSK